MPIPMAKLLADRPAAALRDRTDTRRARLRCGLSGLAALASVTAAMISSAASPGLPNADQPLHWRSAGIDFQDNRVVLPQLELDQGGTHVRADSAVGAGLDFENSTWDLSGNVVITMPEGELKSDKARLTLLTGRISKASGSGAPTQFASSGAKIGAGKTAEALRNATGHSQRFDYEAASATVTFNGEASFSDGRNDITAERIAYNLTTQRISADVGENGQRVQGTIRPQPKTPPSGGPTSATPAPPASASPPKPAPAGKP